MIVVQIKLIDRWRKNYIRNPGENQIAATDVNKYSWTSIRNDIKVSLALKDFQAIRQDEEGGFITMQDGTAVSDDMSSQPAESKQAYQL